MTFAISYKKKALLDIIQRELKQFELIRGNKFVTENSIPILWFGNAEKYFSSEKRIITVSLNPSDKEFRIEENDLYNWECRFPGFIQGDPEAAYKCYNEYFDKTPYNAWFKASFGSVLEGFNASHYLATNYALHTDIGSPYATFPTWSKLLDESKQLLEKQGSETWHSLIKVLEPEIILFSASNGFENKINIPSTEKIWTKIDVKSDTPLLIRKFRISDNKETSVLFQIQGRKPFLRTAKEEKLKFPEYIT